MGIVGILISALAAVVFFLLALEALLVGVVFGVVVLISNLVVLISSLPYAQQSRPALPVQPQWGVLSILVRMVDGVVYSACL